VPAVHASTAFASEQTFPHPPQLPTLVFVLTSQPSPTDPLQLANPALQVATVQLPPAHPAVPFATEQAFPHPPQLPTLVLVLTSHPSAAIPLQSAKPGRHDPTVHAPATHAATPFGITQTLPQPLQLAVLLLMLTSHPSAGLPLQLANPALQPAI
jgi:hypothetical protein